MPSIIQEDLSSPGTHALVIGISNYPHISDGENPTAHGQSFNLGQLSSAARSASEFASWLLNEYNNPDFPLKSLRVLLSPSPGEDIDQDVEFLLAQDHEATRKNVETELFEFIDACDCHKENVAFVYVSGHGIQMTKHDAIVLLSDFAKTNDRHRQLFGAIDMANIHAGMNHSDTAQTQFWFVDACRHKPIVEKKFNAMAGALKINELNNGTVKTSPLFLASSPGKSAYGRPGGISLFCEALMWALRKGVAAKGPEIGKMTNWYVPVRELIYVLGNKVNELAANNNVDQTIYPSGLTNDGVVHIYNKPPQVNLHISLNPEKAHNNSRATLSYDSKSNPVISNYAKWPIEEQVDAGLYLLVVKSGSPYSGITTPLDALPPEIYKQLEV